MVYTPMEWYHANKNYAGAQTIQTYIIGTEQILRMGTRQEPHGHKMSFLLPTIQDKWVWAIHDKKEKMSSDVLLNYLLSMFMGASLSIYFTH